MNQNVTRIALSAALLLTAQKAIEERAGKTLFNLINSGGFDGRSDWTVGWTHQVTGGQ